MASLPSAKAAVASVSGKYACGDTELKVENRRRANNWISECKPRGIVFDCEKSFWFRQKVERKKNQEHRSMLLHKMPPLPFEDWFQEQQLLQAGKDAGEEDAAKQSLLNKFSHCIQKRCPKKRSAVSRVSASKT